MKRFLDASANCAPAKATGFLGAGRRHGAHGRAIRDDFAALRTRA